MTYTDSFELIHQDLAEEASWGLPSLYDSWARDRRIRPFMVAWPSRAIKFDGQTVNDAIPFQLPEDPGELRQTLVRHAKRTAAWALLLVQQRAEAVFVIFESPIGTKSWRLPVLRHGDIDVLGEAQELTNVDYIGVLCRPTPAAEPPADPAHLAS